MDPREPDDRHSTARPGYRPRARQGPEEVEQRAPPPYSTLDGGYHRNAHSYYSHGHPQDYKRPPHRGQTSEWPYRDISTSSTFRHAPDSSYRGHYQATSNHATTGQRPHYSSPPSTALSGRAHAPATRENEDRPAADAYRPRGRSTPFLTEADRQDIMDRIRRGEKQADLAKEYNVSRAAITNLKQRRQMLEMLENSSDAKDRAEAQKRRRLSHISGGGGGGLGTAAANASTPPQVKREPDHQSPQRMRNGGGSMDADSEQDVSASHSRSGGSVDGDVRLDELELDQRPGGHREIRAHTTSRLLSTLLDPTTPSTVFAAALTRHTRLVLEEAIGWSYSLSPQEYNPCALAFGSMEASMCLDEYSRMEPTTPTAKLGEVRQQSTTSEREITVRIPAVAVGKSPVFVFVDASTPPVDESPLSPSQPKKSDIQQCLLLLHALVFSGVPEQRIVVVAPVCDQSVATEFARRFPDLQLVTARFVGEATTPQDRQVLAAFRKRLQKIPTEHQKS